MRTQIFNALKVSVLALVLSFGVSYVYAWTAPTQAPTGGNVAAPINVSSTAQTKSGSLRVSNLGVGADASATIGVYSFAPNGYAVYGQSTQSTGAGVYGTNTYGSGLAGQGETGVTAWGTQAGIQANGGPVGVIANGTTAAFWATSGGYKFPDGTIQTTAAGAGGDNLGNHTATQALNLSSNGIINGGNISATDVYLTSVSRWASESFRTPITSATGVTNVTGWVYPNVSCPAGYQRVGCGGYISMACRGDWACEISGIYPVGNNSCETAAYMWGTYADVQTYAICI